MSRLPRREAPPVTLSLPAAVLPPGASYIRHVIESGHMPGVLSGAELKRDGGPRFRSRQRAASIVEALLGVTPAKVNGCLVWVNAQGARVAVTVADNPATR